MTISIVINDQALRWSSILTRSVIRCIQSTADRYHEWDQSYCTIDRIVVNIHPISLNLSVRSLIWSHPSYQSSSSNDPDPWSLLGDGRDLQCAADRPRGCAGVPACTPPRSAHLPGASQFRGQRRTPNGVERVLLDTGHPKSRFAD